MEINPDLVILDYHLDGKYAYAQKGDVIYEKIKRKTPQTEVVIVSSDHKLAFIEGIKKRVPNGIMFKDSYTLKKLKYETTYLYRQNRKKMMSASFLYGGIAFMVAFIVWFVVK